MATAFQDTPPGVLLSRAVRDSLLSSLAALAGRGAQVLLGNEPADDAGYRCANTLLRASGEDFLRNPEAFQKEAFGNASLMVVVSGGDQALRVIQSLEGNLTGTLYSDTQGADDEQYDQLAPELRQRVGRLSNDKMPTGVAVSPAMNHGGPYPATGHPGFTAVGIPASMLRFGMLQCYDNVRPARLPACLRDNPNNAAIWRRIDGAWKQGELRKDTASD